MITNVPTSDDFFERADSLLHLSYSIVSKLYDNQRPERGAYADEMSLRDYWEKCAASLSNALALVQQAHELYLKGRIASVSPYLLLAREPNQWPKKSSSEDVSFSEFLTVGAAELPKLHDMVCFPRLDEKTKNFLNNFRERRNMFVHQGHAPTASAVELFEAILITHKWARPTLPWFEARISHLLNDHISALFDSDHVTSNLHGEFEDLMKELKPAAFKELLGREKKARWFSCPSCARQMGDYIDYLQKTSQLSGASQMAVDCLVCSEVTPIFHRVCYNPKCHSTVYSVATSRWDESCLKCGADESFNSSREIETPSFNGDDPFSLPD